MVEFLLIPAYSKEEVVLPSEILDTLSPYKSIAIFAAVQFIKLENLLAQLKEKGIKTITTHGKRTSGKFQILGCDCYHESFEEDVFEADAILYVGDGLFHPKALLLAQRKPILLFDPIAKTLKTISLKHLEAQEKKYKGNLLRFMNAKTIGVLVSTKPGQSYLNNALLLKKKSDKEVFIFVDDTFNYANMENYPFIDVWVNTACPRIGFDDVTAMPKPLININDALEPEKALVRYERQS
ncbi:MAG: diphthamide synthesis protein [Nanoarchaeota archaeon]|nr:diphthamide synthesis protein [Nanoarchaeota archaeon]